MVELINNFKTPMQWKPGADLVVFEKKGKPEDGYCLMGFDEVGQFDSEFTQPQYAWVGGKETTPPSELKKIIESPTSWDLAKHRSASELLEKYNTQDTREYIWKLFQKTNDYYYCSILKTLG